MSRSRVRQRLRSTLLPYLPPIPERYSPTTPAYFVVNATAGALVLTKPSDIPSKPPLCTKIYLPYLGLYSSSTLSFR